jgi:ABC-type glycerol-3-phosphate transport system substrate-binding protein
MKRRVLAGLLAGVLALGTLAGCGGGSDTSTSAESETTDDSASADAESTALTVQVLKPAVKSVILR